VNLALAQFITARPFGFVVAADMDELIALDRLLPVLVRCGGCRFTCPAQDVARIVTAILASGDYVRDIAVSALEVDRAREMCALAHAATKAREARGECDRIKRMESAGVISRHETPVSTFTQTSRFNESDCGGAFDGVGVVSDADSGL
jgi:hypothetical protein